MGSIKTNYVALDKYLADDHNTENQQILDNQTNIASNLANLVANRMFTDVAGEAIDGSSTPKAVCFAISTEEELLLDYIGSGAGSYGNVGGSSGAQYGCGMTFTVPAGINKITELKIRLLRPGNTDGNYEIKVRRTNMNSGPILHEEDIAVSSLSTSYTTITLALSGELDVTPGEVIYISALGDGTTSGYGQWEGSNSSFYSGGNRYYNNDASFISTSGDLVFEMSGYYDAGSGILEADANDDYLLGVIGFTEDDVAESASIDVQYHGVIGGFSSLETGKPVYLSDTSGGISHTPGTNAIRVGIAISATEILIDIEQDGYIESLALSSSTTSLTVPVGTKVVIIQASMSQFGSRFQKTDLILVKGSKMTAIMQAGETKGQSNMPTMTATWSGSTITISGTSTTYLGGTVYYYRHL